MLVRLAALSVAFASAGPQQCTSPMRVRQAIFTVPQQQAPAPLPIEQPPEQKPLPPSGELPAVSDVIVVHALDVGRAAFSRCFARARRADPTLRATKVNLHVYLGSDGTVFGVETDVIDASFASCLVGVARRLKFPPPGRTAVANIAFVAQ
jgi:hypothetical protein